MTGISSKAAGSLINKYKYNGYELNTDLDLNLDESFYRSHDPQLGRFWQLDPRPNDFESLYAAMGNNSIKFSDRLGDVYHINGSKEDVDTYLTYLNKTTGNTYKVNKHGDLVRVNKKLNTKTTDKTSGTLSKDIDAAIKNKETVSFNLINNDQQDKGTTFDNSLSGNVDMKDLAKIKDNQNDFLAGVIGHFLEESMQLIDTKRSSNDRLSAHIKGLAKEGQIVTEMNGVPNRPRGESPGQYKIFTNGPMKGTGTYEYIYDYGDIKYRVLVGTSPVNEPGFSGTQSNGIIYSVDKQ